MNKLIITIITLISLNVVQASEVNPISAETLFKNSLNYSFRLSPDGQYYIKHYFRDTGHDVLELHHVDSGKFRDAFRLKVKKSGYIENYFWVDNNTLYTKYYIAKSKYKEAFIELDLDKLLNTDEDIAEIQRINFKSEIIQPLVETDDKVMIQYNKKKEKKVEIVTHQELISGEINGRLVFENYLDDGLFYFPDSNGNIKFSATIDDEELTYWYLKDYQSDWERLFTLTDLIDEFKFVGMLSDTEIAVISNKNTDKKSLFSYNFKTKTYGDLIYQHEKYDLIDARISNEFDIELKRRKIFSVSYREFGRYVSEYLSSDNKRMNHWIRHNLPGQQYVVNSEAKKNGNQIIATFSAANPGIFYIYNANNQSLKKLGEKFPELSKLRLSNSEVFSINDSEGNTIEAIFTKPKVSNGVLIVSPHGGPIGVRDSDTFNPFNQYMASRGYSILNVNFRGSEGFGKAFLERGVGQFGKIIEQDISLAVDKVKQQYNFDKTCAYGSSYGAYSAFMLNIFHPEEYDCAIGAFGIYDLPLLFNPTNLHQTEQLKKPIENTIGKYDSSLKDYSPLYLADKLNSPVLLIAGTDDQIAHIEQSNRMKYRLNQLEKDFEYLFYNNVGHGHEKWKWDWHQVALIDDFIRRKLNISYPSKVKKMEFYRSELMRIADGFNFGSIVKNDYPRALNYYTIAAEHDHPRGAFNTAAFFQSGRAGVTDMKQAVSYYEKAEKLEYHLASFRLGEIYRIGESGEINKKLALSYYKKAFENKVDELYALLPELLSMVCVDGLFSTDESYCLNILEYLHKEEVKNKYLILKRLLYKKKLVINAIKKIKSIYSEESYKTDIVTNDFSEVNFGLYEFKNNKRKHQAIYKHSDSKPNQEVGVYSAIGLTLRGKVVQGFNKDYLVKIEWVKPSNYKLNLENLTPKERDKKLKKEEKVLNDVVVIHQGVNKKILFKFNKSEHRIPGKWKLLIKTLSNETLIEKTFNITVSSR